MSFLTKEITLPRLSLPRVPSVRVGRPSARRAATITGLEISATQAIAAQARLQDGQIVAERVAARPLPHGLLRDGLVVDAERLGAELKELFAEHRLSKRVRVGLATPRTILRVIDLPPLEEKDVRAALLMQAQERIPMPLDRAVLDFQTVGLVDTPEGRRLRVVVVATEREGVEPLLEALRRGGLKPEGIDLSVFAVIRALTSREQAQGPVLYAQLGDLVTIAIAEGGVCRFTRQAPQGLALVLERLAESRAIPVDEALAVLQGVGDSGAPQSAVSEDRDVTDLLSRVAVELGSELRTAAEFYANQFGSGMVTSGIVAGPLAPLPGFVDALAASSGLTLVRGEAATTGPDALGGVDARLAPLATGLAVGELAG